MTAKEEYIDLLVNCDGASTKYTIDEADDILKRYLDYAQSMAQWNREETYNKLIDSSFTLLFPRLFFELYQYVCAGLGYANRYLSLFFGNKAKAMKNRRTKMYKLMCTLFVTTNDNVVIWFAKAGGALDAFNNTIGEEA